MATTTVTSGTNALNGVFSGIDTTVLIQNSLRAYQQPIDQDNADKAQIQAKQQAVAGIQSVMGQLQTLLAELKDPAKIQAVTATSSSNSVLTAEALSGAPEGTHLIEVNRLATSEREVHGGATLRETWTNSRSVDTADSEFLSPDEVSDAAGTNYKFVFQFGSEGVKTVDLSAYGPTGMSLNQLVNEINTSAGYAAASAVAVNGKYTLRLTAQNAGTAAFTVTDDNSVAALDGAADFTRTTQGGPLTGDTYVGAGQFVYTYNGVKRTIQTAAQTTLSQLCGLINNDTGNPGVNASLLKYNAGAGDMYHLVLAGKDTGADHTIQIDDTAVTGTTLNGTNGTIDLSGSSFQVTQQAQNSQIRVDGYPAGAWIERDSNDISDILPLATIHLQNTGSSNVTFSRDISKLQNDLSTMVSVFNTLVDKVDGYTRFNVQTQTRGLLQGDSIINMTVQPIRDALVSSPKGFQASSDKFTMAWQIGLSLDKTGKLSLDQDTFSNAVSQDYDSVLKLVSAWGSGDSSNAAVQFNSALQTTTPGIYNVKISFDQDGKATAWIKNDGAGDYTRQMSVEGSILSGAKATAEAGLSLTANWNSAQGAYTVYTTVRVLQGFAGKMAQNVDGVLDSTHGAIKLRGDQYSSQIASLNSDILSRQKKLDAQQTFLQGKYARMEAAMAQLDQLKSAITAISDQRNSQNNQ